MEVKQTSKQTPDWTRTPGQSPDRTKTLDFLVFSEKQTKGLVKTMTNIEIEQSSDSTETLRTES